MKLKKGRFLRENSGHNLGELEKTKMKYLMNASSFTFVSEPALRFVRPIEANYSVSGLPGSVRIPSPHPVLTKDLYWFNITEI